MSLGGIDLHFIHERRAGEDPLPILLLHGWPSSVWEFHKIFHLLTDAGERGGFSVVVPSLPGYGFSFRPFQDRFGLVECADVLSELMTGVLGYEEYLIAGGDWGAHIGTRMSYAHPDAVLGLHLNMLPLRRDPGWPEHPSEEESAYLHELGEWQHEETGYSLLQGTRPQTPAYALTDSPIGLAAWIVEKFARWSDGDPEPRFSKDDLITTLIMYWATGAIGSSFWPYYTRHHGEWIVNDLIQQGRRIETPTCYIQFPREIIRPPTLAGGETLQPRALDGCGVRRTFPGARGTHYLVGEHYPFRRRTAGRAGRLSRRSSLAGSSASRRRCRPPRSSR